MTDKHTEKDEIPLCKCHNHPMRWIKDKRNKKGGWWKCRIRDREDRRRRYQNLKKRRKTKPAPEIKPLCECHSVEMFWHKDITKPQGGRWRCKIRVAEVKSRWDKENPDKVREKIRRWNANPKSKMAYRRYWNSEKGKEKKAKSDKLYRESIHGYVTRRRNDLKNERKRILQQLKELNEQRISESEKETSSD